MMQTQVMNYAPTATPSSGLRSYYVTRAAVAAGWVLLAVAAGRSNPAVAAPLLVLYPAWDAFANLADARRSGGLAANKTQTVNFFVSALASVGVAIALGSSMRAVLTVFGAWAVFAGILQVATGVRRWKLYGAQWAVILSGAQSALVGAVFFKQANGPTEPDITAIAPYAAFGAIYFLIAAISLTISAKRRRGA